MTSSLQQFFSTDVVEKVDLESDLNLSSTSNTRFMTLGHCNYLVDVLDITSLQPPPPGHLNPHTATLHPCGYVELPWFAILSAPWLQMSGGRSEGLDSRSGPWRTKF